MSASYGARGLFHLVAVRSHGGLPQDLEGERSQGSLTGARTHHQCSKSSAVKYLQVKIYKLNSYKFVFLILKIKIVTSTETSL